MPVCPLCTGPDTACFHQDRQRTYWRCDRCALVFVDSAQHLSRSAELAEYYRHQNHPFDPFYRRFLGRLTNPLLERISPEAAGLDFGCGPGPALALMLREKGFSVATYDAFFAPFPDVLERHYDFITATEVVEHLHQPGAELHRLWHQLNAGGWLGIMTKLVIDAERFSGWHYKNDPTHVCFFSRGTFQWLSTCWNARLEILGSDVILLQKPA